MDDDEGAEPGAEELAQLTSTERRVFDFVRDGKLDAEIAVRLGIGAGDVKDHIQRAAAKLDVAGKQGLRDWVPKPAVAAQTEPGLVPRPRGRRLRATAGLYALVLMVAAGGLFWLATRGGGEGQAADASSTTPTQAATAAAIVGLQPSPPIEVDGKALPGLTWGETMDYPEGLVVWIERGCASCQANQPNVVSLVRLWRPKGAAEPEVETMFATAGRETGDPFARSIGVTESTAWTFGAIATPDGSEIVMSICTPSGCEREGGRPETRAFKSFRTTDGGVSWRVVYATDEPSIGIEISDEGLLVVRPGIGTLPGFLLEPGGRPVTIPEVGSVPNGSSEGRVLWEAEGGIYLGSERVLERLALPDGYQLGRTFLFAGAALVAVLSPPRPGSPIPGGPLLLTDAAGETNGGFVGTHLEPVAMIGDRLLANAVVPSIRLSGTTTGERNVVVLVDLATGTINPLDLGAGVLSSSDRNRVVAGWSSERVFRVAPTAGCAVVFDRDEVLGPFQTQKSCLAEGVLVRAPDVAPQGRAEPGWEAVELPGTVAGWIRSAELEE